MEKKMSKKLEKKWMPAIYIKKMVDKTTALETAEFLNVSDSYIYTAMKNGEASYTLELAATAIYKDLYPESPDTNKKHVWMVKVPDNQTDTLGKLLTALGCKYSRFIS